MQNHCDNTTVDNKSRIYGNAKFELIRRIKDMWKK